MEHLDGSGTDSFKDAGLRLLEWNTIESIIVSWNELLSGLRVKN